MQMRHPLVKWALTMRANDIATVLAYGSNDMVAVLKVCVCARARSARACMQVGGGRAGS